MNIELKGKIIIGVKNIIQFNLKSELDGSNIENRLVIIFIKFFYFLFFLFFLGRLFY